MSDLVFRAHAIRRMFQRGLATADVREVVERGETIEERPDDLPYPSRLVLGFVRGRPLHVVVAEDAAGGATIVVTVYEPDPALWRAGHKEAQAVRCVICRQGETRPGTATLVLERGGLTMVVKHVPAQVCENCGEEYVGKAAAERALAAAERAAGEGVEVEIREYAAA